MAKNSTWKALLGLLVLVAVLAIGADRGAVYFAQSVGASKLQDYGAVDPKVKIHDLPALQNLVRTRVEDATLTASEVKVPILPGDERTTISLRDLKVQAQGLAYKPETQVRHASYVFLLPDEQIQKVLQAKDIPAQVHTDGEQIRLTSKVMGVQVTGKLTIRAAEPTSDNKPQIEFVVHGVDMNLWGYSGQLGGDKETTLGPLPLTDLPAGTTIDSIRPVKGGVQLSGQLSDFHLQ